MCGVTPAENIRHDICRVARKALLQQTEFVIVASTPYRGKIHRVFDVLCQTCNEPDG